MQPTTNYHPPSASGKSYNRQTTAATAKVSGSGSSDYHLSALLNKENKALQNLLAAVELNRTTAVSSNNLEATGGSNVLQPTKQPISGVTSVINRATASAKQQMHMMHMQQQQ